MAGWPSDVTRETWLAAAPVSFASILKSRLPFGAMTPLPVSAPMAGATRFKASMRMPSGATRSVAASV